MSTITLKQAALWCGGRVEPKYEEITFLGANNDSRKLTAGQLFVALDGQRDGHDFIPMALERGAAAVLCRHVDGDYPAIVVADPRKALGDIAREERRRLNMKVVGITGSVGKSTTKEMIADVLSSRYRVGKTPVNHNNDIGMPMAILSMAPDVEVAVLEMGMNHFGEISYLTSIAQPDIAVITNIGTMHIEHLGSREGILRAKLEILEGLRPGGSVVFPGDEPLLWALRDQLDAKPVYFGMENRDSQVYGCNYTQSPGKGTFTVLSGEQPGYSVELPLTGRHFAMDALAAIGVGQILQVPPDEIAEALEDFHSMQGRQRVYKNQGFTIIEDCYNAGPESMVASLEVLHAYPGRKIAVLGDMLELGSSAQAQHYRIGRVAARNCDLILALGIHAHRVISGAITGGMRPERAVACQSKEEMVEILRQRANPGDVLLFKGSRGMKMESVLEAFLRDYG